MFTVKYKSYDAQEWIVADSFSTIERAKVEALELLEDGKIVQITEE